MERTTFISYFCIPYMNQTENMDHLIPLDQIYETKTVPFLKSGLGSSHPTISPNQTHDLVNFYLCSDVHSVRDHILISERPVCKPGIDVPLWPSIFRKIFPQLFFSGKVNQWSILYLCNFPIFSKRKYFCNFFSKVRYKIIRIT